MIELLVVISIIALLVAILLPALGAARQSAVMLSCVSQHKSVAAAVIMYLGEENGYFPFRNDARRSTTDGDQMRWYYSVARYLGLDATRAAALSFKGWYCPAMDDVPPSWKYPTVTNPGGMYGQNANLMPVMQADGTTLSPYHNGLLPNQQIRDVHVDNPTEIVMHHDHKRPLAWATGSSLAIYGNTLAVAAHFGSANYLDSSGGNVSNEPISPGLMGAGFVDGHANAHRKEDFSTGTGWESWRVPKP